MKSIKKNIILLSVISIILCVASQCNNNKSKCGEVNKAELIFNDIIKRKYLYPIMKDTGTINASEKYYLFSSGLVKPGRKFYLDATLFLNHNFTKDSVEMLSIENDTTKVKKINMLYIRLKETNTDTTDFKVSSGYGMRGYASTWATFHYVFDKDNCKLILKDSTFGEY